MIDFANVFKQVQNAAPSIQCITNFVTVNDCANLILAAGGSPSMAHDVREVEEAVTGVHALVCNLGAIGDGDAMVLAGRLANRLGKPVVLDPVAVGGTQLRRDMAKRLLEEVEFSVIRGNASEIRYLAGEPATGSGVDAGFADTITEDNLAAGLDTVSRLARRTKAVIALSGKLDIISDGNRIMVIHNGCDTMARITGSGCMMTAMIGTYCGAVPQDIFAAACTATAAMGVCGEVAERKRLIKGTGNATFRTDFIDAVFNLTARQLAAGVRCAVYNR